MVADHQSRRYQDAVTYQAEVKVYGLSLENEAGGKLSSLHSAVQRALYFGCRDAGSVSLRDPALRRPPGMNALVASYIPFIIEDSEVST